MRPCEQEQEAMLLAAGPAAGAAEVSPPPAGDPGRRPRGLHSTTAAVASLLLLAACAGLAATARGRWPVRTFEDALLAGPGQNATGGSTFSQLSEAGGHSGEPIPLVVYVTANSRKLYGPLAELWEHNRKFLPKGTRIAYFSEAERAASVKHISASLEEAGVVDGAYRAYTNLRPGAYLADLWRYMVLWQHGGIYMDANTRLTRKLTDWMDVRGPPRLWVMKDGEVRSLANGILAAPPRDKRMARVIRLVVQQIHRHAYPDEPLALTGPGALGAALEVRGHRRGGDWTLTGFGDESLHSPRAPVVAAKYEDEGFVARLPHEGWVEVVRFDEKIHHDTRYVQGASSYWKLEDKHQVYCDEPGPPCHKFP